MGIKIRILVVDNDPQVLQLITEVLTQMGTDVECVKSGLQAAALIEKEKYDGFFLDWTAPEIGGAELVADRESGGVGKRVDLGGSRNI